MKFNSLAEAREWYSSLPADVKEHTDYVSRVIWTKAKLPALYFDKTLEKDWVGDTKSAEQVKAYLDNLEENVKNGIGIHFSGPPGTGKTFLACYVLKEAIRSYDHRALPLYVGLFVTFSELVDRYIQDWKEQSDEFDYAIKNSDILVIDDLGHEYRDKAGINQAALDNAVRTRIFMRKPTLITTGRNEKEIISDYGDGIASLFAEGTLKIIVTGEDYRKRVLSR